jgi:hypothetical protein
MVEFDRDCCFWRSLSPTSDTTAVTGSWDDESG